MTNKINNNSLSDYKNIENNFNSFVDKEGGSLPVAVADYFDLLKAVNISLNERITELKLTLKANELNYQANNELIDYVIDTYQGTVKPYLEEIQLKNEDDKMEILHLNIALENNKKAKAKGGSCSPYRQYKAKIIPYLEKYKESQSSFDKLTLQNITTEIESELDLKVNLNTVKKWWTNFKQSEGETIFTAGNK